MRASREGRVVPGPSPGRLPSSHSCRLRSETAAHLRITLSQALMLSPDGEKPPTRPRTPTPPRRPRGEVGVECDLGFSSLLSNSVPCKLTGKHWEKRSPPGLSSSSPLRDYTLWTEPPRTLLDAGPVCLVRNASNYLICVLILDSPFCCVTLGRFLPSLV